MDDKGKPYVVESLSENNSDGLLLFHYEPGLTQKNAVVIPKTNVVFFVEVNLYWV